MWISRQRPARFTQLIGLAMALLISACSAVAERDFGERLPRLGGDESALAEVTVSELDQLARVSTSLVVTLVQHPELDPLTTTIQFSLPSSAFGNTLLRALEDAGYGIQQVEADQGERYVAYRRRFAETDRGPVTDYEISVGDVRLRREFVHAAGSVYPVDEQPALDFDRLPQARPLVAREVFERVRTRRRLAELDTDAALPGSLTRLRRTSLFFDHDETRSMGAGNKQAVSILVRDTEPGDLFVITACTDPHGRNEAARLRGLRVVDEFRGHGLPISSLRLGPCRRASYRHQSDDSPVPVEVVQYRQRTTR